MTSKLHDILESKAAKRKELALKPIREKLEIVEQLAERTLAVRSDSSASVPSDPWKIPPTWRWDTMGNVANIVGGGTPRADHAEYFGEEIPWITPADLSKHREKTISRGARSISRLGLERSGARLLPRGTVLFSSRAPIGYVAIAANPVATNQGFKSFVLGDELEPDFVYYYLLRARELAVALASGTTFLEISGKNAARLPVPIAPLPEQRRIVAEIEKQFARLDSAVTSLNSAAAKLRQYRASILFGAVSGKLIPERSDSAGLPQGWTITPLSELVSIRSGNTPSGIETETRRDGEIAWFKVADMNRAENQTTMRVADRYISRKAAARLRLNIFPPGTVIFPKRGGAIATNKKRLLDCDSTCDLNIMALTPPPELAAYFALWFSTVDLRQLSDGSNVPQINNKDVRSLPVPVPPADERDSIVAEVERRLTLANEIQRAVEENQQRANTLRQSILQRAFSGQL